MTIALFNYILFFALFALALEFLIDQIQEMRTGEAKLLGIGTAYGWSKIGYGPLISFLATAAVFSVYMLATTHIRFGITKYHGGAGFLAAACTVFAVKFFLYTRGVQTSPFGKGATAAIQAFSVLCAPMFAVAATTQSWVCMI